MQNPKVRLSAIFTFFCLLMVFKISNSFAQRNPFLGAGNSYVNVSKRNTGGVVQVGDTLEIRTNYFFASSYNSPSNTLYKIRYLDSVPLKTTMLTGVADSLRLITNEGFTFRNYTLTANDDPATYNPTPPAGLYQVRINIGQHNLTPPGLPSAANPGLSTDLTGAGAVKIGSGTGSYKPQLFGGLLITTAFRVKVTGAAGDTIVLAAGKLIYRLSSGGVDTVIYATPYKILISGSNASGLCGNALGSNLASEYGGTFSSGTVQNRTAGPFFPIPTYNYKFLSRSVGIGDGDYAFVNNLSPTLATSDNARMRPNCNVPAGPIPPADSCDHRMHGGFWDIMGDHTGTNNSIGNPAAPSGTDGGYMLVVNSDVVTSTAYKQNVTGLCPDTYYEFSAWIKNVCKTCGIDSNSTSLYNPGVLPNLAFSINDLDIYSTGQLDTVGWQKKGFVFKTGSSQTTALIAIRNNASGGGGNDWVIDDIALGTCGPAMSFNYKPFVGCSSGTQVTLSDTISYSFNPKYSWYKWERSTNNGVTWGPPPVPTSDSVTIGPPVNGIYKFYTDYPTFIATSADSGHFYRVIVATSQANLSSATCSFTDGQSIFMNVITCPIVLSANMVSFTGRLNNDGKSVLKWLVSSEKDLSHYEIEKSRDGVNFFKIGESRAHNSMSFSQYDYNDEEEIKRLTYFRLKIYNNKNLYKYSKVIVVDNAPVFIVNSLLNPFHATISADVILPSDGTLKMTLFDGYGKVVGRESSRLSKGLNKVSYTNFANLSQGMYYVSFEFNHQSIERKMSKVN